MTPAAPAMQFQRNVLGALTIALGLVALWMYQLQPELSERYAAIASGCARMTPVLAVLWLALPDAQKGPRVWLFILVAICAVAFLFKSGRAGVKFLIPALIALAVLGFLRRFTDALTGKNPR